MKLIIPGKPIAKKRPRFARHGKFVRTYSDQETEEGRFLWEVRQQINQEPFKGAVSLVVGFYMPIPKNTSKKRSQLMEKALIHHIKKPDLDNLEKFVSDCLKGEAWVDDSQVVHSDTTKVYSANPRTEILIKEV